MFVLFAGFWQPSLVIVAILMMYELHASVNGEPVGMNVQWAHEDRNHQSLVVEILVLVCFLNHHYLAVGRSHDGTLCVTIKVTDGATVEVKYHEPRRN